MVEIPKGSDRTTVPRHRASVNLQGRRLCERPSVIDSIVDAIVDKIVSGELKDGDILASQDELARSLGVSRASLREALNRLALLGIVESRHGSGTYIRTAKPQHFMSSLSSLLIMDHSSVAELLQARFHVESAIASLAATNASDEEIQRMGSLIDQMKRDFAAGDADGFVSRDAQFHLLIGEGSRNRVLVKVLEVIREILPQFIRKFQHTFPTRIPATIEYHQKIYEAIKARDPVAARQQMEAHISFLAELNDESLAQATAEN